ncbi:hypothetical protein C8Q80DRAFT_1275167 [Daedaleopsis nitida]|nr:hypothetical protein C8Q80DRAFT_1275167 [Daedaleopsis nitida]
MTLWAKKISLGEATIYDPPHCLNFDRGPAKRPRNSKPPQPPPQVHVTIHTGPMGSQAESTVTATTTPLSTREATPIEQSRSSNSSLGTRTASQDLDECRLAAVQDLTRLPKATPGQVAYPHVSLVIALLDLDMPQHRFRDVQQSLLDMGIDDACKLLLLPEDLLSQISGIGAEHAKYLHIYAGYGVAPVLGMQHPVQQAFQPGAILPPAANEAPQWDHVESVDDDPDDNYQEEEEEEEEEVDELED